MIPRTMAARRGRFLPALAFLLGMASLAVPLPSPAGPMPRDTTLARLLSDGDRLREARQWVACDSVAGLALARAERAPRMDSAAVAHALFHRGNARYGRAMYSDTVAHAALLRSIRIQERLAHPDSTNWIGALDVLGRLLTETGQTDSALAFLGRARTLCGSWGPGAETLLDDLWISIGRAYRRAERDDQAIAAYDSARALRERRLGPNDPSLAEPLAEIGTVQGRANQLDLAMRTLERSVAILERAPGQERALTAPLAGLASVQFQAGDIGRSIETLERVIAIHLRASGPDSPRLIPPLYNIGLRLFEFGDYAGAYEVFGPLVRRAESSFGPGNGRTETIRYMAGATAMLAGDTASAAPHLLKARAALLAGPLDENHIANLIERYHAMLWIRRGDRVGAARVLAEGLAREHATPKTNLDALGQLLEMRADVQMASFDSLGLDSTLAEMAERFGDSARLQTTHHADYLRVRARAETWRGRDELAWRFAIRSEEADRAQLMRNARALPDARALQLEGVLGVSLDPLLRLSAQGGPVRVAEAWDRVIRWRGLVSAELAQRRLPLAAQADTSLGAAHARWTQALRRSAQIEVAAARGAPGAGLSAARAELEKAEREFARLAAARGVARETTTVDLAHVRSRLEPQQALVSLAFIDGRTDTARLVAFVTMGPEGVLSRVDLGPARPLLDRIAAWRASIGAPPVSGRARRQEQEGRKLGMEVRAATWDRLSPLLAGARSVVLVGEGPLAELPWHALPTGRDRYLVETGPTIYTPAAERELLRGPGPRGQGLLAVGDPDFDAPDRPAEGMIASADPAGGGLRAGALDTLASALPALRGRTAECGRMAEVPLPRLPGARAEVEEIARAWSAAHGGEPAALLVGDRASERAWKDQAPGRRVIHLATHGIVWGEACTPVYEGARGVGGVDPLSPRRSKSPPSKATKVATSPAPTSTPTVLPASPWSGRRVWLALAGARRARAGTADENEGLLTADEVLALDLSEVDWVVLSACQSAVGQSWPLEGSVGMRRAFRMAGARSVIASQWSISDASTREWMRALYRARTGQGGAAGALRAASLEVLQARRARGQDTLPFHWAAFTASGW